MIANARILVVDDERSARETIEALLTVDRYQLSFASNGREALEVLGRDPIDLVLCDVMMPVLDGFEVCRTIKAHVQWRFVPVILVTALDGQDDMVRGVEAGAEELLIKPVEKVVLRARIRSMLRVRAQYTQLQASASDLEGLAQSRRELVLRDAGLSEREREVLDLLLLGRSHDEIAAVLGISPRTSKFHQANILEKLGADSRVDLVRLLA